MSIVPPVIGIGFECPVCAERLSERRTRAQGSFLGCKSGHTFDLVFGAPTGQRGVYPLDPADAGSIVRSEYGAPLGVL